MVKRIVAVAVAVICAVSVIPTVTAQTNEFLIYGLPDMSFEFHFVDDTSSVTASFSHRFDDKSSFYDNPFVLTSDEISSAYQRGDTGFQIYFDQPITSISASRDGIPLSTRQMSGRFLFSVSFRTSLEMVTYLLNLGQLFLFPSGYVPDYGGITPTPFVNDSAQVTPDSDSFADVVDATKPFAGFISFIFTNVIPWAGFLGVMILVFVVLRYMLRG